jgi:hypothetical protein
MAFLVEVSGTLFSDSGFYLVYCPHFSFYKMLFMNILEFSCFPDFFYGFLEPENSMVFFKDRQ